MLAWQRDSLPLWLKAYFTRRMPIELHSSCLGNLGTVSMSNTTRVDIASPEHKSNPYPFYALLRAEMPIHPVILPDKQTAWLITRYEDVAMTLTDKRFMKDRLNVETSDPAAKRPWVPAFARP